MKIADVCEFYAPRGGGVRNYIEQKFAAAKAHGHELVVIAPGATNAIELRDGGKIVWVETPVLPFDRNYRMFWSRSDIYRVLDHEAPDLVEGSSPWRGGWIAGQWPGCRPKVLFMHADPVAVYPQNWFGGFLGRERVDRAFGWFWSYLRKLSACFDATVVTGTWLKGRFGNFGLSGLTAIPFGVDRRIFNPDRRDLSLRRDLLARCGLDENAFLLIAVGRHHPEKRFDILVRAFAEVQRIRPAGLVIVGDGLMRAHVEQLAASHPHIVLTGHIGDRVEIAAMLASADALLHGSSSETFGFAVAEAVCCGLPIVVPNAGGACVFAHEDYAEVYSAGDWRAAARACLQLLERDRGALSRAAAAAAPQLIGTVESHFEKLFTFYEALALHHKNVETLAA